MKFEWKFEDCIWVLKTDPPTLKISVRPEAIDFTVRTEYKPGSWFIYVGNTKFTGAYDSAEFAKEHALRYFARRSLRQ